VAREGALPLPEALTIVREVADALAHAHRRGVVHRDVKPDNVMLADGHALVMDFGVAKALSDARSDGPMTSVGMAIGTPAYMAPEQAAGDPTVDHRADIYALGCLAYEALGGRPPFTGTTPQQILAAQISRAPAPLASVRADLPGAVGDAVMRCLAKLPAERFDSAADFRTALDGVPGATPTLPAPPGRWYGHPLRVAGQYAVVATALLGLSYFLVMQAGLPDWVLRAAIAITVAGLPVLVATGLAERRRATGRATGSFRTGDEPAVGRHLTWRRAITLGGVAFAALFLAATTWMGLRAAGIGPAASLMAAGKLAERDRLVVADFDNRSTDSTLGGSITEAFRIDLGQSPMVTVLNATQVQGGLARMGRAPGAGLDTATARELAVREGAKAYVAGEIRSVGPGYVISARLVGAADGGELVTLGEKASDGSALLAAVDRLAGRLRERMGESLRTVRGGEPLERVTTSSLEALRLYSEAQQASSRTEHERAIELLKQALAIDSGFAMAWRKLAAVYQNARAPQSLRLDAATRAYRFRDRLPPNERDQAVATYFWSVDPQPDSAERAFKAVLARTPDDITALNNYGMLLTRLGRPAEAEPLLRRGLAIDSALSALYVNLGTALSAQHKTVEAGLVMDAYERNVPGARGSIVTQRLEILGAAGRRDSVRRLAEAELPRATAPTARRGLLGALGAVATTEGRITEADARTRELEQLAVDNGRPMDAFGSAMTRAFLAFEYRHDTVGARRTFETAVERYKVLALPAVDRPYRALAEYHLERGDEAGLRRLIADYRQAVPDSARGGSDWTRVFEAEFALRAGRATPQDLAYLAAMIDSTPCRQCASMWLGRAYDLGGMADSALAHYERAVPFPGDADRLWEDQFTLPRAYKRLGELYEQKGNRTKALQYYGMFVELWRNADPDLQPVVREVKQRMAQLAGEPR
jgi:tetratricopeptide (TPR) repeat protein/TolB-like protein